MVDIKTGALDCFAPHFRIKEEEMFSGTYYHSVDTKGRVIIPAKFRAGLSSGLILNRGLDNCLFLYPMSEWMKLVEKMKEIPLTNKEGRVFVRMMFANAVEAEMDKQGRLLIPSVMREYANIDKDLVSIGVGERVELWSKEEWESYNNQDAFDEDAFVEKMSAIGVSI